MQLTTEQSSILSTIESSPIVCVSAKAGCGKTSTCLSVVAHLKPKNGLYTAFNKSIVEEAKEKFPSSMNCQTKHAFALKYVRPKKKIEPFTYLCIKEDLSYPAKKTIIDAMDAFFLSDSVCMESYMEVLDDPQLEKITIKYIHQMLEEKICPTFNFLLKYLHLQLAQGIISIDLDLAILDECQDTTAVFFEIFMLINAKRKLIVGDPHQNIYGYMNTVNAFDLIHDVPLLPLTTTFRCSAEIASRVQVFGETYLSKPFNFVGKGTNTIDNSIAYISRTNGSILMRIDTLLEEGQSFTLTKPVKELLALPMALVNVVSGKPIFHKKYMYLETEYKKYALSGSKGFYRFLLNHVDDEELHGTISFMNQISKKNINIFQLKKDVEAMRPNPNIWVVTSHSFKGREVGTVYIEEDLNRSTIEAIEEFDRQELNLAYVACTRAKHTLLNCKFL